MPRRNRSQQAQHTQEISENASMLMNALKEMITIFWGSELPTIFAREEEVTLVSYHNDRGTITVNGCKRRGNMLGCTHPAIVSIADRGLFRHEAREGHTTLVFAFTIGAKTAYTFFENIPRTLPVPPEPAISGIWVAVKVNE